MAGEVIVDALPYIDQGYDEPGIREAVSSFVMSILFLQQTLIISLNLLAGNQYGRRRKTSLQTVEKLS